MTLSDLKTFLIDRRRVSLTEIGLHFDSAESAVRPMLEQWIAKGRVRPLAGADTCGCGKAGTGCACAHKPAEMFEWVN